MISAADWPIYDRWYHDALRWVIRGAFRFAFAILARLRVEGAENVPRRGAVILAPNHISAADWPAVGVSCPRWLRWMAKAEMFDMPVVGQFCRLFHAFPVHRGTADRASLRLAEEILHRGDSLVIFPEGGVSEDAKLQPLKHGLALVALRTCATIVPVGVIGTNRLVPFGENLPRPTLKPVRVRYGAPIEVGDLWHPLPDGKSTPPRAAIAAATARVEAAIRGLIENS